MAGTQDHKFDLARRDIRREAISEAGDYTLSAPNANSVIYLLGLVATLGSTGATYTLKSGTTALSGAIAPPNDHIYLDRDDVGWVQTATGEDLVIDLSAGGIEGMIIYGVTTDTNVPGPS